MEPTLKERMDTLESEIDGIAHFLMNKAIPVAVAAGAILMFLVAVILFKS